MQMHTVPQRHSAPMPVLEYEDVLVNETMPPSLETGMMYDGTGRSETVRMQFGQGDAAIIGRITQRSQPGRCPVKDANARKPHPEAGPVFVKFFKIHGAACPPELLAEYGPRAEQVDESRQVNDSGCVIISSNGFHPLDHQPGLQNVFTPRFPNPKTSPAAGFNQSHAVVRWTCPQWLRCANYTTLTLLILFALLLKSPAIHAAGAEESSIPPLAVSEDGRYLVSSTDGTPLFWLADTAWGMVNLTPADVDDYLQDRASRRFNVIQGPIILRRPIGSPVLSPNYAGDVPLLNAADGVVLNEHYMQHVDYIVEQARVHGLYIALAVVWGGDVGQIFSVDDTEPARALGSQLGRRYKDKTNVIWIVCGEYQKIALKVEKRKRLKPTYKQLALINALAEGIESGHGGANLMTIHPDGSRSSSEYFHDAEWLDFNMIQTFSINPSTADIIEADWKRSPAKPVVNAEPAYEGRDMHNNNDPVTPWKVRYEAYQSVFQGAMGHTYGHSEIWQPSNGWRNALDSEGSRSMGHLRALMESRPAIGREPYQTLVEHRGGKTDRFKKCSAVSWNQPA
ncbi:MAG: DUF4038 domain-containing protein [Gammaproteobacteria bacterium]|nr:DUF4038 domain-containing protein [Gammaproteobacteria bacterium]